MIKNVINVRISRTQKLSFHDTSVLQASDNFGAHLQSRKIMYRGWHLFRGRKVKEVCNLMIGESTIEVPVNSGHNYNGLKIVKFIVG